MQSVNSTQQDITLASEIPFVVLIKYFMGYNQLHIKKPPLKLVEYNQPSFSSKLRKIL